MANFSVMLLVQLLFLTAGYLTTAAPVGDICRQTKKPSRCIDLLVEFDPRSTTADLPVLEQIAIEEATGNSRQVKNKVHDLFSSTKDPNLKKIYGNCDNLYAAAVNALVAAPSYLKQGDYAKLAGVAGTVGAAVNGCAAAGLKGNDDVGVIGEAIGLIAKKL